MNITINFDMDGTIANLYANNNWLEKLRAEDPEPYKCAMPMLKMNTLARKLNELQRKGYRIAIISWLSKVSSPSYDEAVTTAKLEWLNKHLKSVSWDEINIVPYGTPKVKFSNGIDILFDDEKNNREIWESFEDNKAYCENEIMEILRKL